MNRLDAGEKVAHLASFQDPGRLSRRGEHSYFINIVFSPCRHQDDVFMFLQCPLFDANVDDHASELVVMRIDDERLKGLIALTGRPWNICGDRFENLADS